MRDADVVMVSRGGQVEPLPCALRAGAKTLVAARLAEGRRSLHGLGSHARVCVVQADALDGRAWLNANTPAEWAEVVRRLPDSLHPAEGGSSMPFPYAYRRFATEHPEVIRSYESLAEAVRAAGPLDARTASLVKLAIALAAGLEGGAHSAVRKAVDAGCTREEVLHVSLLGLTTMGFPAMMRARSWVLDVLDGKPGAEK